MKHSRRLALALCYVVGTLAFLGAVLWGIGGAGLYGSPIGNADAAGRIALLLILAFGPAAILPCTILEHRRPSSGGFLLTTLSMAQLVIWWFAAKYAPPGARAVDLMAIATLCLVTPNFVLGSLLFLSSASSRYVLRRIWWAELVLVAGLSLYFAWYIDLMQQVPRYFSRFLHWLAPLIAFL